MVFNGTIKGLESLEREKSARARSVYHGVFTRSYPGWIAYRLAVY